MEFLTRSEDSVGGPVFLDRDGTSTAEYGCRHSRVLRGSCLICKKTVTDISHLVAFNYILDGLKLGVDEVARLKNVKTNDLLFKKKLHLVLDLDQTLIHAKPFAQLTSDEETLKPLAIPVKGYVLPDYCISDDQGLRDDLFKMECGFLVKLRPFVRTFLREASSMFEIWVCTKGNRSYANLIVKILGKGNDYFSNMRVITREDLTKGKKSLELVLARENCTIIIDDSSKVWVEDHVMNLIEINKYFYFKEHTDKKNADDDDNEDKMQEEESYFEKKSDESESNGGLSNALRVLKKVHELVFQDGDEVKMGKSKDVRSLMNKIATGEILISNRIKADDQDERSSDRFSSSSDVVESTVGNSGTAVSSNSKRKADDDDDDEEIKGFWVQTEKKKMKKHCMDQHHPEVEGSPAENSSPNCSNN